MTEYPEPIATKNESLRNTSGFFILNNEEDFFYSLRKESTGFALATFQDCVAMAMAANPKMSKPGKA